MSVSWVSCEKCEELCAEKLIEEDVQSKMLPPPCGLWENFILMSPTPPEEFKFGATPMQDPSVLTSFNRRSPSPPTKEVKLDETPAIEDLKLDAKPDVPQVTTKKFPTQLRMRNLGMPRKERSVNQPYKELLDEEDTKNIFMPKIAEKKFSTQARMSVGGKGFDPKKKLAERHPIVVISDDEEPTPIEVIPRRSKRLQDIEKKDYNEDSTEPKDFAGDSDWEDDRSPGYWGNGEDCDSYEWGEEEEKIEPDPEETEDDEDVQNLNKRRSPENQDHGDGCCQACRAKIEELSAANECRRLTISRLNRKIENMEWQAEEDYTFFNRNIRKLFNEVDDLKRGVAKRSKWEQDR